MDRRTVVVIFEGFQLLDLAGPADVFATANLLTRADGYDLEVAAVRAGQVSAQNGIVALARTPLAGLTGPIDTLLVVGGLTLSACPADRELVAEIARLAPHCRRITSVCNGAFLLAAAGLLTGRRATTHWLAADRLAAGYPQVRVDADAIYVKDANVWTSAGVTAGIDLALALVAEDHGHELARQVARGLVVYLQRPGGQSQFSTPMRASTPPSERFRELQAFIDDNPTGDLSVPALARRSAMSERHFSRLFTAQTGMSPGRYVERSRAEAARRRLEVTADPLDRIARESGLGGPETLYRIFRRHWRISPGDYRRRFHAEEL
ncbi:GlxA family transcriptional regulator [Amorphoplanes digitatis]|uniref:Transcriptional regulator GlxA family with amidase domain n=1 Tax=Actinoplanes digitatis TaxID=1868 RepID=A0A7W7I0F8_9ACTN|nr:DJ-1/PfpI family protein [Actinoplanes digitatis]MBB4764116.1 transcriptional regulator GlxA family with amidase domain [Actinoplanes digitatis]GID97394.1 putative transcriptional regulator, AraC family protein [Actinoplanes digitatis]